MNTIENDPFGTTSNPEPHRVPPISVKDWVITIIITAIPLVGIIMLFVWAFGSSDINPNKKNYATAALIVAAIGIVLYILLFATMSAIMLSTFDLSND